MPQKSIHIIVAIFFALVASARAETANFQQVRGRGYTSAVGEQGLLEFDGYVNIPAFFTPPDDYALSHINYQLWNIFGALESAPVKGGPLMDSQITILAKDPIPGLKNSYRVSYHYKGTAVFQKAAGKQRQFLLPMPINPVHFFETIITAGSNHCVTYSQYPQYADQGHFFYFWNPYLPGCELRKGRDYDEFSASFTPYPNTELSYPEYNRLPDARGEISVSIFFGLETESKSKDPFATENRDYNADIYQKLRDALTADAYLGRRWSAAEIAKISPKASLNAPVVEEFFKDFKNGRSMRVRLFFGSTDFSQDSTAFQYFMKDAVENSSIIIYLGHSGLGGNLGIKAMEQKQHFRVRPAYDRYQIVAVNGCSSYGYYTQDFFNLKSSASDPSGAKNLDMITNGLVGSFAAGYKTSYVLLRAVEDWATGKTAKSYQRLAADLEDNALLGISGDSDNPKKLP